MWVRARVRERALMSVFHSLSPSLQPIPSRKTGQAKLTDIHWCSSSLSYNTILLYFISRRSSTDTAGSLLMVQIGLEKPDAEL